METYRIAPALVWVAVAGVLGFGGGLFGVILMRHCFGSPLGFYLFFSIATLLYLFFGLYVYSAWLGLSREALTTSHLFGRETIPFSEVSALEIVPRIRFVLRLRDGRRRTFYVTGVRQADRLLARLQELIPEHNSVVGTVQTPAEVHAANGMLHHLPWMIGFGFPAAAAFSLWGQPRSVLVGTLFGIVLGAFQFWTWKRISRRKSQPALGWWIILWMLAFNVFGIGRAISPPGSGVLVPLGGTVAGMVAGQAGTLWLLRGRIRRLAQRAERASTGPADGRWSGGDPRR